MVFEALTVYIVGYTVQTSAYYIQIGNGQLFHFINYNTAKWGRGNRAA